MPDPLGSYLSKVREASYRITDGDVDALHAAGHSDEEILEHGHRLPTKVFQRIAALVFRDEMDDVAKAAMHRPGFFGRPLFDFGQQVLRGPSYWTPGEREYLAVFGSR